MRQSAANQCNTNDQYRTVPQCNKQHMYCNYSSKIRKVLTTPKFPSPRMETRRNFDLGNSHGVYLGFLASTDDPSTS